MARTPLAAVLAALLLSGCAVWRHGSAEQPVLTAVEIRGNHHVATHELIEAIATVPTRRNPFAKAHRSEPGRTHRRSGEVSLRRRSGSPPRAP